MTGAKRIFSVILFTSMVLSLLSCSLNVKKKEQNKEIDLKINVDIKIPERVDVDFTQYMGTDSKDYYPSKDIHALKTNRNYSFKNKKCHTFDEYIYNVQDIIFAPASGLSEMFGLEYTLSADKNSAEISYNNLKVTLTAFADYIKLNGEECPFITTIKHNDVLLIPVEDFAEAMGYRFVYDSITKISYISSEKITEENKTEMEKNYKLYEDVVYNYEDVKCDQTGVGLFEKSKPEDRLVGIAYTTWHRRIGMWDGGTWSYPLLKPYASDNRDVIYQHGKWLAEADVDFVFVDWSNNTGYDPETMRKKRADFRMIEEATDVLFEVCCFY